ncbi:MAG: hypothetical protein KBT21_09310 [Treponema sp.]|nr:hypothetical protein [Candidatus Treponema merdequi]
MSVIKSAEIPVSSFRIFRNKVLAAVWSHKCLKCGLVEKDEKSYGSLSQCPSGGFHSWCNTKI